MNVVREIQGLNERELELGVSDTASWHAQYAHSAYVFIGGLDTALTEGDVICVLSQCGEVVDVNLVRDKETGKSRGFAFLAYEDQRSAVLAVDNLNGAALLQRTLRVDHADRYRRPKEQQRAQPSSSAEAEFLQFDGDASSEYDARRKAIWDYEAFPPLDHSALAQSTAPPRQRWEVGAASSAPTSYSVDIKALGVGNRSEDTNAARILRLWEERQARKREREDEERRKPQKDGHGRHHSAHPAFADSQAPPPAAVGSAQLKHEERKEESGASVKGEPDRAEARDEPSGKRRRERSREHSPRRSGERDERRAHKEHRDREQRGERHRHRDRSRSR